MELFLLDLPARGLLNLPAWGCLLVLLLVSHVSIASITVFLHRNQSHRALDLHPVVSHFFRFWLWMTTGTVTKEWVSIHRKHHARVETEEDPHSPQIKGIDKVLWQGYEVYREGTTDPELLTKYGHSTPDDWLERHVYTRRSYLGITFLFFIYVTLFGFLGMSMFAIQMAWQPFFAAGVINGLGHWWGYRNYEVPDASTNIVPWGILVGGEELHNNHHAFPSSARFSNRWWELDIGWVYIRVLEFVGLARVKKIPPEPMFDQGKARADLDTLRAVITNRFQIMSQYASTVMRRVHTEELRNADTHRRGVLMRARKLLAREESLLSVDARNRLEKALAESKSLETVYEYKRRLQAIWQERTLSQEGLVHALQEWCKQAEASGIRALQEFARMLPTYSMQRV